MKINLTRILLFTCFVFTISACGNNNASSTEQSAGNTATASTDNEDVSNIEIFKSTDCATCHKRSESFAGPAFTEIAMRYPNAADTTVSNLALTIINGSFGKWKGTTTAMTPHPALSKTEAENMVKYILQIKK